MARCRARGAARSGRSSRTAMPVGLDEDPDSPRRTVRTPRGRARGRAAPGRRRGRRARSRRAARAARCSVAVSSCAVGVESLEQDVEVAHGAEPGGDVAQAVAQAFRPARPERVAEDPPPGAHPARRDAHLVEVLRVCALRGCRPRGRAIRAKWKRRILRPASATWSSARTPGDFGREAFGGLAGAAGGGADGAATDGGRGAARPFAGPVLPSTPSSPRTPSGSAASGSGPWRGLAPERRPARCRAWTPGRQRGRRGSEHARRASSSRPSSPRTSSTSSSTHCRRPGVGPRRRPRRGSARRSPPRRAGARRRRSWRIVTISTSGASPHISRIIERASEGGHSSGPEVRSARSLELLAPMRPRSPVGVAPST